MAVGRIITDEVAQADDIAVIDIEKEANVRAVRAVRVVKALKVTKCHHHRYRIVRM